ncbi:MAG TPA: SBBP repeat-containing protein [bacterium]|nr:SBBP repeat-containing protein [bacterium]
MNARTSGAVHRTQNNGSSGTKSGARCGHGGQPWVARYDNLREDMGWAVATDASGNVYVTGISQSQSEPNDDDYATVKYNADGTEAWHARYGSVGAGDAPSAIAVDAHGNVYVTGRCYNADKGCSEFGTVKYDASGSLVWDARYGNGYDDAAQAIALDASGNVYVTGNSLVMTDTAGYDQWISGIATVKYNASDSHAVWVRRYSNGYDDGPMAMAWDAAGNVYVTGYSKDVNGQYGYATVEYAADGDSLHDVRESFGTHDYAEALGFDAAGNVYVTGTSYDDNGVGDYVTVKYDANLGRLWPSPARYDGPVKFDDEAYAMAVDASGNSYVTGVSYDSSWVGDYATVKYDADGHQQWVAPYDNGSDDGACGVALDASSNVYVTGYSYAAGDTCEYATIKYDASGNQSWVARYSNGCCDDRPMALAVDALGDVCVTGYSLNSAGNYDYATLKYGAGTPDMGVSSIDAPVGMPAPGSLVPQSDVYNCGTGQNGFDVVFSIDCTPPYVETVHVPNGIPPDSDPPVQFPAWAATDGYYTAKCSTITPGDTDHANDAKTNDFIVAPPGWSTRSALPKTPSGKDEDAGGWLAYNSGDKLVYAAKGNSTADFYAFNPRKNSWTALTPIPKGRERTLPDDGCRGVTDGGDKIYMTKGNGTLSFWSYSISTHTWTQLADVPRGCVTIEGGAGLAYAVKKGVGYVYLLKGNGGEFYKYNTATGMWNRLPDAPGYGRKDWPDGSWLVYDGDHTLYAHNVKFLELWSFDIATEKWGLQQLPGMPERSGRNRKKEAAGPGSAAAWLDGAIYALKGNSTNEFWRYDPAAMAWTELDTVPLVGTSGKRKKVDSGGDITATENMLFAFKGNSTSELWRYVRAGSGGPDGPGAVKSALATRSGMELFPNPASARFATLKYALPRIEPARVTLVDVSGREVVSQYVPAAGREGSLLLDLRALRAGVYIVRLEGMGLSISQKLIIER